MIFYGQVNDDELHEKINEQRILCFFWKGQSWYNFDMRCDVVDRFVRRLKKK